MPAPDKRQRPFHVVLWGASGFTGKLVAEYLARHRPAELRWAIAGRSEAKLRELRTALAAEDARLAELPLLTGDSHDRASLTAIAEKTRVVCTTVGPYAIHGSELVAACVEAGTDSCDLTGEAHWIRRMIDAHHGRAGDTGARIVPCCGFDSIPSDLGVQLLQESARERHGAPCRRATLYLDRVKGGFSGGTIASMKELIEEASRDPWVRKVYGDPYALNPDGERQGPDGRDDMSIGRTAEGSWTGPFMMAAINTRIVRRSNALAGYPYGRDFSYAERMRFGGGARGLLRATGVTAGLGALGAGLSLAPARKLLERTLLPSPGQGPSREAREAGMFRIRIEGEGRGSDARDFAMGVRIEGDSDPGYGETAKMLAEAALSLALDDLPKQGGVLTPATAMGAALLERLRRAGMRFDVA